MTKNKLFIITFLLILITLLHTNVVKVLAKETDKEVVDKIETLNEVIDFTNIILNIDNNEASIIGEKKIVCDEKTNKLKEVSIKEEEERKKAEQRRIEEEKRKEAERKNINTELKKVKGKKRNISGDDYEYLLRIVEAEAGGEGLKGKILVANVIFNRYDTGNYKNVKAVIFEPGQFSPVSSGRIYSVSISTETKEAVQQVLDGTDYSSGALYFLNPRTSNKNSKRWFDNHLNYLFTYKNHAFYK